jgi:type II secretory pathway pseudopilin PulG
VVSTEANGATGPHEVRDIAAIVAVHARSNRSLFQRFTMKVLLSLLATGALVGVVAFTTGDRSEALPQQLAAQKLAIDDMIASAGADTQLPQVLLDYLSNPNDATAIDKAWNQPVPMAMDVVAPDPSTPMPVIVEGKEEQATFECVAYNRIGTKWCVTVTYTCKDGMVVPGNPDIADCTSGWHLPYEWSVSIDKNGKVRISITTLGINTITTCRWAPECDC